ncbi:MAG: glycosyltransferase [Pseudomonadota bacterium]
MPHADEPIGTPNAQSIGFDAQWYLKTYTDVAGAGIDPWTHYIQFGRSEGRRPHAPRGSASERDLWSGFANAGLPKLEAQADGPPGPEQDMARWWLARWHFAQGHYDTASKFMEQLIRTDRPLSPDRTIGTVILAALCALETGNRDRARKVLAQGRKAGMSPTEIDLVRANIEATPDEALNKIWRRAGLGGIRLQHGTAPALDRLIPRRKILPGLPYRMAPRVSVIVPAFNAANTLPTALTSLLFQRWKALDIVVVDDGSTDATGAVAKRFAMRDPRIRVITSASNEGAYIARNRGIMAAKSNYITVLDADDWCHPDRIAQQVRALIANPDIVGSLSHWVRVSPELKFSRWRIETDGLVHRNVSSLMIRRDVLNRLGVWDRVRVNADTEYYYRILAAYGGASLTEVLPGVPLSLGRCTPTSLTGQAATHLGSQIGGLRAAYLDAALSWHSRAVTEVRTPDGDSTGLDPLYLPEHPAQRPFAIPPEIGVGDPPPVARPEDVIRSSPLFDTQWYLEVNEDVRHASIDPALHYLQSGAAHGRDPSPKLSTTGYRAAYLTDASPETNPILHWHKMGCQEGIPPLPRFDGALAQTAPQVIVFGHQVGEHLFGAERSFLDMLVRMQAAGTPPMAVLPHVHNMAYLDAVRERTTCVVVVPYLWRHAIRTPRPDTQQALEKIMRAQPLQAVHINTCVIDAPAIAARAVGLPVVVHVRERPDQDETLRQALDMNAETIRLSLLKEADHFVANSPDVAAWLAAPERTRIVPNQVDPALFHLPRQDRTPPCVALISSNITKKGIADFVALARHLEEMGKKARCLLIGPESADLTALRPLPDTVETPGYATDPIAALIQADIVLNLSKFAESFGRSILEAMAAGRPVVCYNRGHLGTLVEDGVSGIMVTPDDPLEAAKAVALLLSDKNIRIRMGAAARRRARALVDSI